MCSCRCNRGGGESLSPCFAGNLPLYTGNYVAMPPISHELPPGDKAELATDGNQVIAFLTDGPQTCARFLVPDFLGQLIKQVEGGKSSHSGEGT